MIKDIYKNYPIKSVKIGNEWCVGTHISDRNGNKTTVVRHNKSEEKAFEELKKIIDNITGANNGR